MYAVQVLVDVKEISPVNHSDEVNLKITRIFVNMESYALKALIEVIHFLLAICFHLGPQINLQNHQANHLFLEDWNFSQSLIHNLALDRYSLKTKTDSLFEDTGPT